MRLVKVLSLTTVVYSSGPVTPWMWNAAVGRAEEPEVDPQPGGLDEDLRPDLGEQDAVAAHVDVALDRVRDVGVDVVLRRAGRVVGRRLLAVDRPPREQRPRSDSSAARSRDRSSIEWRKRSRLRVMRGSV
jgi:hypothetical protein